MALSRADLFKDAWRAQVLRQLDGDLHVLVRWSRSQAPTLQDVALLRGAACMAGLDEATLLQDDGSPTVLEQAAGHWHDALDSIAHSAFLAVPDTVALFNAAIAPSQRSANTRQKYFAKWCTCLTWAVARKLLGEVLPMSLDTLKALTWDMMSAECNKGQIQDVWDAVQTRHKMLGLIPPVVGQGAYSAWMKSFSTLLVAPAPMSFPVQKEHIRRLLALHVTSLAVWRDLLITVVATLCCLRPGEVAALQVCDLLFDFDFISRGLVAYQGTCAVHVRKRKNDQAAKGLYPRIGKTRESDLDVVFRLRNYLSHAALAVHAACDRAIHPALKAARCRACSPVFPRSAQQRVPGSQPARFATILTTDAGNTNMVSQAIRSSMERLGANGLWYTGKAGRKGGISTALEAGVPESVLFMQSGHSQSKAAQAYMHFNSPELLYATFDAFGL